MKSGVYLLQEPSLFIDLCFVLREKGHGECGDYDCDCDGECGGLNLDLKTKLDENLKYHNMLNFLPISDLNGSNG